MVIATVVVVMMMMMMMMMMMICMDGKGEKETVVTATAMNRRRRNDEQQPNNNDRIYFTKTTYNSPSVPRRRNFCSASPMAVTAFPMFWICFAIDRLISHRIF